MCVWDPWLPVLPAYLDVVDMMVGAEDMDIDGQSVRYDYSPVYHDRCSAAFRGCGGGAARTMGYPEQLSG